MKSIILTFVFFLSFNNSIWSQTLNSTSHNPIDLLVGEWVQKTTSIEPAPLNDDWKSQTTINEFIPVLGGKGLYRRAYDGESILEGFFFYDAGSKKLIGMSVDENGYVWQTTSILDDSGKIIGNKGGAISDKTAHLETEIDIINESEIQFVQHFFDGDKEILTVKGYFIKVR